MRVDLGCFYISMAELLLYGADISARLQQVCSKRMTQRVRVIGGIQPYRSIEYHV
jgi:hypothetical protein